MLLNLKEVILKQTNYLLQLLNNKDTDIEKIYDIFINIENKIKELPEMEKYILFEKFYDDFMITIENTKDCIDRNDEDFCFFYSHLYHITSQLLTTIINAKKILIYEINTNFNFFIKKILND